MGGRKQTRAIMIMHVLYIIHNICEIVSENIMWQISYANGVKPSLVKLKTFCKEQDMIIYALWSIM